MSDITWLVYRDRYPFDTPTLLGDVTAPDKATALARAKARYTGAVLVQSLASHNVAKRELALPLKTYEQLVAIRNKKQHCNRRYYAKRKPRPESEDR